MKKLNTYLIFVLTVLMVSCSTKNYNEREIIGRWFSIGWLQNGLETDLTAWFEFNEDKTYRAVIARNQEEGTWWIDGYKLYTQAKGEERIVVKIERLDEGNLEIRMNRGGQDELLIFTRGQ
ncbi:MAG TPA: hypothetical protein VI603_17580 [Saprospiraceae bacterium]|nr:hypothetical protein [Saprospiraceae bacterium]